MVRTLRLPPFLIRAFRKIKKKNHAHWQRFFKMAELKLGAYKCLY